MIKSITGLLGFLFVISSCYSLVFWDRFNVDIFQYMSVEDIIKGVVYSMRSAILLAAVAMACIAAGLIFEVLKRRLNIPKFSYAREEVRFLRSIIITMFLLIMIPGIIIHSNIYETNNHIDIYWLSKFAYAMPFFSLLFGIATYRLINIHFSDINNELTIPTKSEWLSRLRRATRKTKKEQKPEFLYTYSILIQYASIGAFFYFLTSAITLGILNAEKIISKNEYDYATGIKPRLIPSAFNAGVIYLGATSTRLIFADTLIQSHFIVNKDSVLSLHVHHMDPSIRQAKLVRQEKLLRALCDSILSRRRINH